MEKYISKTGEEYIKITDYTLDSLANIKNFSKIRGIVNEINEKGVAEDRIVNIVFSCVLGYDLWEHLDINNSIAFGIHNLYKQFKNIQIYIENSLLMDDREIKSMCGLHSTKKTVKNMNKIIKGGRVGLVINKDNLEAEFGKDKSLEHLGELRAIVIEKHNDITDENGYNKIKGC